MSRLFSKPKKLVDVKLTPTAPIPDDAWLVQTVRPVCRCVVCTDREKQATLDLTLTQQSAASTVGHTLSLIHI